MVGFRPRYSLRFLFVATALVALAVHWLTLPSRNAVEFERRVRLQDDIASIRLFGGEKLELLTDWGTEDQIRRATVRVAPLTWSQFLRAERCIYLHLPYGTEMLEFDWDMTIRATPRHLEVVFAST